MNCPTGVLIRSLVTRLIKWILSHTGGIYEHSTVKINGHIMDYNSECSEHPEFLIGAGGGVLVELGGGG
jgi:hypothetical protein